VRCGSCWWRYYSIQLISGCTICRIEDRGAENAENEILRQISCLKLQRVHQRNLRQPVCRLPVEMLIKCLSFLTVKDQLSVIRVCRHLRTHAVEAPTLWTRIDQIRHPTVLSLVLECAKGSAVDIINLGIRGQDDETLHVVASHMHHVRILDLHFDCSLVMGTHAVFTTPAPLLERLSFRKTRVTGPMVRIDVGLNASNYPRLFCVQLTSIKLGGTMWSDLGAIQSLRTFSIDGNNTHSYWPVTIFRLLSRVTTFNLELAPCDTIPVHNMLQANMRRINIRWTKPGFFDPSQVVHSPETWNSIQSVHIAHVGESSGDPLPANLPGVSIPIPAQATPYRRLQVRTSGTSSLKVHFSVVHENGRERVFCGLHPATVSGIAARIPELELSTLTVGTGAVALNILSNSTFPALRRIRLVSDTLDNAWINIFVRDMLTVPTLEQLEFSIDVDVMAFWTTKAILRVLASCMAAGHDLQKVVFLGFAPESRCVARAEGFAEEVVVDRRWYEPKSERSWFTEPAFEW